MIVFGGGECKIPPPFKYSEKGNINTDFLFLASEALTDYSSAQFNSFLAAISRPPDQQVPLEWNLLVFAFVVFHGAI